MGKWVLSRKRSPPPMPRSRVSSMCLHYHRRHRCFPCLLSAVRSPTTTHTCTCASTCARLRFAYLLSLARPPTTKQTCTCTSTYLCCQFAFRAHYLQPAHPQLNKHALVPLPALPIRFSYLHSVARPPTPKQTCTCASTCAANSLFVPTFRSPPTHT